MKQALIVLTAFVGLVLAGSATAGDVYNKPGMWETTTTVKMEGMPAGMPGQGPMTTRHCVTEKDMQYVPKPGNPQSNCKVRTKRLARNKMRVTSTCINNGMTTTGVGEFTFTPTTSKGHMDMTMTGGPGGKMVMHQTFTSRWIGPCK
jgi:hypothetical protein